MEVIGREEIARAEQILRRYKQGKSNLENRIVKNQQWYKLRHWGQAELPASGGGAAGFGLAFQFAGQ